MLIKETAVRDYQEQFVPYLDANETVLWVGKPRQGLTFQLYDLYAIPFAFLWLGMVLFFGLSGGGTVGFFLIPFVLVGFYILIGRFLWEFYERRQTFYALTERRVLILSKSLGSNLRALMLNELSEITLHQKRDGRGTILFAPPSPIEGYQLNSFNNKYLPPRIEDIAVASEVYKRIRHAQERVFEEGSDD